MTSFYSKFLKYVVLLPQLSSWSFSLKGKGHGCTIAHVPAFSQQTRVKDLLCMKCSIRYWSYKDEKDTVSSLLERSRYPNRHEHRVMSALRETGRKGIGACTSRDELSVFCRAETYDPKLFKVRANGKMEEHINHRKGRRVVESGAMKIGTRWYPRAATTELEDQ